MFACNYWTMHRIFRDFMLQGLIVHRPPHYLIPDFSDISSEEDIT